ncbi:SNF2 family N-terminal domain-containing protein [Xylaria sp. FL0043]|nr:SNF2 family N-terminal domain-containing protein [Xylaria sp. FL0043]
MASDSNAHQSANRSKSGNKGRRPPVPEGVEVVDLTEDNDESPSVLALAPRPKRPKISGSPKELPFDGNPESRESFERGDRRTDIDITEKIETDIGESWVSKQEREKESSDESSLSVKRSLDDGIQTNELSCSKPGNHIAINGLRLSVLRAAFGSNWTPSKHYDRWTFSPEPSTDITSEAVKAKRPEDRQKDVGAYNTCFGMLLVDAETCLVLPTECTPVTVAFSDMIAKFYLQDQNVCAAVFVSQPLRRLFDKYTITLTGSICGKKLKSTKDIVKRQLGSAEFMPRLCTVRIFVYGLADEEFAVGEALSQAGMFLQHPGSHEIDGSVKYHNPQYFLPPGQDMPPIEELRVSRCCRPPTGSVGACRSSLGELERSQILRIFDSAYELSSSSSVEPSPRLQTKLKKHQLDALMMMMEKEAGIYENAAFPPLWKPSLEYRGRYQHVITGMYEMKRPPPVGGGILADEMGLGKTLSILSLICRSLDAMDTPIASSQKEAPRATLVVTPKSTIPGWEKQIQTHIREGQISLIIYHGQGRQKEFQKSMNYDIVLTTYETLRSDWEKKGPLFSANWDRIVLDEAHKIRNYTSKAFNAVFSLSAQKRWCLTGTPIQNSLADFGALLLFVRVPPFDQKGVFARVVEKPLEAKEVGSLDRLRKLIAATTLRRTKANHATSLELPRKIERLEMIELSEKDRRLYEFFKRRSYLIATWEKPTTGWKGKKKTVWGGGYRGSNIIILICLLRLICNHGEALLPEAAIKAWRNKDENAIDWEMLESGVNKCIGCDTEVDSLDAVESTIGELACGHVVCLDCAARSQAANVFCPTCKRSESNPASPPLPTVPLLPISKSPSKSVVRSESSSLFPGIPTSSPLKERYVPSDKVEALLRNINDGGRGKHVVFSCWTKMLDLIAKALKMGGLRSQRIDGQASLQQRKDALEKFNNDSNYRVMLASIGAAGEGIELTAATTVHIIEPHWNPSAEAQAVDRVHRFGQKRDVTVIRYVATDSIEEYVQWIQAEKLKLIRDSFSVADENEEDVHEKRWNTLLQFLKSQAAT